MRALLILTGLGMLGFGVLVLVLALTIREARVQRRAHLEDALRDVVEGRPARRPPPRVRRGVVLELADRFAQDTLEGSAPHVGEVAAAATSDLNSIRWLRRARGLRTLQSLGLTVDELVGALGDRDRRVRAQAATAAVGRGEPEVVDALVRLLQDPDPYVRFTALDGVSRRSAGTAEAVARALDGAALLTYDELPPAERAIADADLEAARAVRELATQSQPADPTGAPRTERVATGVVAVAMRGSEDATPGAAGTLPRPLRATTVAATSTRTLLLLLRGASATTDASTIAPVRRFVGDARPEVRAAALEALAALGADPQGLLTALQDVDGRVRSAAVTALGRSGNRALAGPAAARLTDRDYGVRQAAAAALVGFGPAGLLLLRAAIAGPDRYAADAARSALGLPPAPPAAPATPP